jgi:hypothetical protein
MKPTVFEKNYEVISDGLARKRKVIVNVIFAEDDTEVTTA